MPVIMIVNFISTVLAAFAIAMLLGFFDSFDALSGILSGLMITIFWIATNRLNDVLYEKKPFGLFVLNVGYSVVTYVIMGIIIGVWH